MQIVARLMVEELRFHGLRDAADTADTADCLDSDDTTCSPRGTDWSATRFFIPNAAHSECRLAHDAQLLWNAFEEVHNKNGLPGELEIPMESFARAGEIMLKSCWDGDAKRERPDQGRWLAAVKACGYVQARLAVRKAMAVATGACPPADRETARPRKRVGTRTRFGAAPCPANARPLGEAWR